MSDNHVPLIDREIFFGDPQISGGQISPNGKFITFMKPYKGVRNIWVKDANASFEESRPLSSDTSRPIGGYFWSRDSRYVLYVQDKAGDENFRVYALDPNQAPDPMTGAPIARDLTPYDGIRAKIFKVPKSDPNLIYVGINDRDKAWHDLYCININSGKRELVLNNDFHFNAAYFDLNDELKVLTRTTDDGGTELLRKDNGDWKSFFTCTPNENVTPYKFHQNGQLYMSTDKGDERDISALVLIDINTGEIIHIEDDPDKKVDFGGAIFSDLTDELIGTKYIFEKSKIYWRDKNFESDYKFLVDHFDQAEISFTSGTQDEVHWIVFANKDTDPGSAYLFSRATKEVTFLYRPRPDLPVEHLCEMTPVSYKSSDGLTIPAYMTLPKVKNTKSLPFIIMPHGGPWARDYWGYNGSAQFFANRGYGVLMVNFRGSTGFGKSFLNKGNREWGKLMQDDLTYGVKYVCEKAFANPKSIAIYGGSYGGYAALAGLTFTPDLYAAGVSIVGPSNLFTLLETIPPYWASALKMFHIRMGDPNTEEGKELLKEISPFFHASNIKAPLLVAQGDNDPRVKTSESNQIVVACRESGQDVQYLNFLDEGHGFANPNNSMAFIAVCEKFLAQHLGGRYQADRPSQLQKIIDDVTVDIASVAID